jgi:hypothetical protein
LNNDQLHTLFVIVLIAMVLGMAAAAVTLSQERLPYQIMIAALLIAWGAWIDSGANNLTRPEQLYWSQALIAFGTTLFLGPALLYGFIRMLSRGPASLTSFVVLFSLTQNIGGLAGAALLGSYQVISTRAHLTALSEHLLASDPQVAARLQAGAAAIGGNLADPALRAGQGGGLLFQATAREANFLAFNDVFGLVALLALATALYVFYLIVFYRLQRRRAAAVGGPA